MTRNFKDQDRQKKKLRIQIPENPANLSQEKLQQLEAAVMESLKEGYLPCPVAWKIAKDFGIPRIAVGSIMDRLGIRVTDCQIGFFKVDKTPYIGDSQDKSSPEITTTLRELDATGNLTCSTIFDISLRFNTTPLKISQEASILNLKIRNCQLGCF